MKPQKRVFKWQARTFAFVFTMLIIIVFLVLSIIWNWWQLPSAGWDMISPVSEIYNFLNVHLVTPDVGFAVGKGGIIIKTEDGGDYWEQLSSGTTNDLYGVHFIDPNTGTVVGDTATILHTADGGLTWSDPRQFPSSNDLVIYRDISFTDALNGFVVGGIKTTRAKEDHTAYVPGLILRTNDGGVTWQQYNPLGIIDLLNAVYFVNSTTGTAVGGATYFDYYYNTYATSSTIMRTTDGGESWNTQDNPYGQPGSPYSKRVSDVCFYDPEKGIAVGGGGVPPIYTSDGETWETSTRDQCEIYWISSVSFVDADTAVAVGGTSGAAGIYRSIDAGHSWSQIEFGTYPSLEGVSFAGSNNGVAVGRYSTVIKSDDGGQTWGRSASFQPGPLNECEDVEDLHFIDSNTGFAVSWFGSIIRTNNGGQTWERVGNIFNSLRAVYFIDDQRGIIGGSGFFGSTDGGATWSKFRTTDNGDTWMIQDDGTPYCSVNAIHFCDGNTGYIVGYTQLRDPHVAMVLRTTDGSATWNNVSLPADISSIQMTDVFCIDPQKVIITGVKDWRGFIVRTTDGGATWTQNTFEYCQDLNAVHFVDENIGYAVGGVNEIYRTDDGGATWVPKNEGANARFYGVFFTDANNGWAVGYYSTTAGGYSLRGVIYHTSNGGETWTEQGLRSGNLTDRQLNDVFFVDNDVGVVVGEKAVIIYTDSGGQ